MSSSENKPRSKKKPVSENQLAAQPPLPPNLPDQKARRGASQHACEHGLSSANFTVVRLADINEIARLRADLITVYQPVNSGELFALEQMALRRQAMLRAARFEAGLLSACLNECLESDGRARFPLHEDITNSIEVTEPQLHVGRWLLPSGPPEQWHSVVSALPGSGRTPLPTRCGGIRAVEEAAAGAAKRTHFTGGSSRRTPRKHTRFAISRALAQQAHSVGQASWPV